MSKKKFGFIAGASGVGKGYGVGRVIKGTHGVKIFTTGDWCRDNAEKHANSGVLVNDDVFFNAVKEDFDNSEDTHYFIDAPRSVAQAEKFIKMFLEKNPEAEIHTIHIDGTREICELRLKDRASRHGRTDDAEMDIINRRLENYFKEGGISDTVIPALRKNTAYHLIDGNVDLEVVRKLMAEEVAPRIFEN